MYHNPNFFSVLVTKSWESTVDGKTAAVFFNASAKVSKNHFIDMVKPLVQVKNDPIIIHKKLSRPELRPFYPLLDIIQNKMIFEREDGVDKFLKKSGVYPFHKEVFSSYYKSGFVIRSEKIIPDEQEYEKGKFFKDILGQLTALSNKIPLVIIIEGLEYTPLSTLNFIEKFMKTKKKGHLLFIGIFNRGASNSEMHDNNIWNNFIKRTDIYEIKEKKSFSDLVVKSTIVKRELKKIIYDSWNAFHLLCLEESRDLGIAAYERIIVDKQVVEDDDYFILLETIGNVYTFLDDNDNALIFFNMLLTQAREKRVLSQESNAYQKISFVYYKKNDLKDATRYGQQALKLATKLQSDSLKFNAYFNLFLINDKSGQGNSKSKEKVFYNMEKLSQKMEMNNHLTYSYGVITTQIYDDNYDDELVEQLLIHCDIMINISNQFKNGNSLAAAYHNKGMLYSLLGQHETALSLYRKSERLKLRLGSKNELIRIYNGLGYEHYLREDYEKAFSYFKKSIKLLKEIRIYEEIALTLFNMGVVYIFAQEHVLGINYLEKVLALMNIMDMKVLPFHTIAEIYCFICVAYIKSNRYLEALKYLSRCQDASYAQKGEERLIFKVMMALVHAEEGRQKKSISFFVDALKMIESRPKALGRFSPRVHLEYGLALRKWKEDEKAVEVFKRGEDIAVKISYKFHRELLKKAKLRKPMSCSLNFSRRPYDTELIMELAKQQRTLNKLHNKVSEINFLNNLQSILVQNRESENDLFDSAMHLIDHSFLSEITQLLTYDDGVWKVAFQCTVDKESNYDIDKMAQVLSGKKQATIISTITKGSELSEVTGCLNSIIFIPMIDQDKMHSALFLATKRSDIYLSDDDLRILVIAAGQLNVALQLLQAKMQLRISAIIDGLTGLYNRAEMNRLLLLEEKRANRDSNQAKEGSGFSILFIDLDNFKYYNDTFGHHVGDLVLKEFADILKRISRDTDICARFGGDEFIVIAPTSKKEEAAKFASRIYVEVIKLNHFQEKVEKLLKKKIQIPEKYKLTCSVGVSQYNQEMGTNIDLLLQNADSALYKAKENGKNQIYVD